MGFWSFDLLKLVWDLKKTRRQWIWVIDSKKTISWLCGLLAEDNCVDDTKDLLLVPLVRIGRGEPVAVAMGICWVLDVFSFSFSFFFLFNIYFEQLK